MILIIKNHKTQKKNLPTDTLHTLTLLQTKLPLKKTTTLTKQKFFT